MHRHLGLLVLCLITGTTFSFSLLVSGLLVGLFLVCGPFLSHCSIISTTWTFTQRSTSKDQGRVHV